MFLWQGYRIGNLIEAQALKRAHKEAEDKQVGNLEVSSESQTQIRANLAGGHGDRAAGSPAG